MEGLPMKPIIVVAVCVFFQLISYSVNSGPQLSSIMGYVEENSGNRHAVFQGKITPGNSSYIHIHLYDKEISRYSIDAVDYQSEHIINEGKISAYIIDEVEFLKWQSDENVSDAFIINIERRGGEYTASKEGKYYFIVENLADVEMEITMRFQPLDSPPIDGYCNLVCFLIFLSFLHFVVLIQIRNWSK
jgi:hypothetical protein